MSNSSVEVLSQDRPTGTDTRGSGVLGGLARFVLAHRKLVALFWLVAFIAGVIATPHVQNRLSVDFSLPGQPGYETGQKILHTWGNGGLSSPDIVVVTVPAGQSVTQDQAPIAAAFQQVRISQPQLRVVDYAVTQDASFLTNDGRSTFAYVFAPLPTKFTSDPVYANAASSLQHALPPGYHVGLTGIEQLSTGGKSGGPGVFTETMVGALGALVVLAFVFASLLALLPLLIAAVAILVTFLVVLCLTFVTDVSFIVEFLVALVGLGLAIDYSLLLVTRWREERASGKNNHDAVVAAVETAGRTVTLSGLTVAIGLLALIVLPVPGLRSTGIGGVLIPLVSIVVVLTLLPALLGGIGPRVDWPHIRHEDHASRAWSAWARGVVRHRWLATIGALAILAICIIPVFHITVGQTSADALAQSGPARVSYDRLLAGGVPSGVLTPMEVLTTATAGSDAASSLQGVDGVHTAALPSGPTGTKDGYSDVIVIPTQETVNNKTLAPVRSVQAAVAHDPGVLGVAGLGPIQQDYANAVFANFPLMFSLIALLMFILLCRAFRSVLLAIKAVVLNLLSLAATFGFLVWFWQDGHGSEAVFGIPATGAITFWVPLMVFAFLFGLSMDYEVFMLSRIREEYDRTGSTLDGVVEGVGRTGRLVTCAALILFLAFASLSSAPNTDVKVLATGLGVGILLDATVVRALLVPALITLFGRANWWMPAWLGRVLFVKTPKAVAPAEVEAVSVPT
jgi:putative drug exporter of the RND superfamily